MIDKTVILCNTYYTVNKRFQQTNSQSQSLITLFLNVYQSLKCTQLKMQQSCRSHAFKGLPTSVRYPFVLTFMYAFLNTTLTLSPDYRSDIIYRIFIIVVKDLPLFYPLFQALSSVLFPIS